MLAFLDTEFTCFERPTMMSLALVAEDNHEFYAECTDYPREECSHFVVNAVIPLLGRIDGAGNDRLTLSRRLRTWFEALPGPATIVCDFEGDWRLLLDALDVLYFVALPANLEGKLILGSSIISDPVFEDSLNRSYTADWPPHHALADARALRNGYVAWKASMDLVWGAT